MGDRTACLSLDLEPDCGGRFDTFRALDNIPAFCAFFKKLRQPLTVFITGRIFEECPESLKALTELDDVEFGVHGWSHRLDGKKSAEEIHLGTERYIRFFGNAPFGYRAPQGSLQKGDTDLLARLGYRYDSSVVPTWRPGKYNNLFQPDRPYRWNSGLLEMPITILRPLPIPLGLSHLRLFGRRAAAMLLRISRLPDIVIVYFHLHDLIRDPRAAELSGAWNYIYQRNVPYGPVLFCETVDTLKRRGYRFTTMDSVSRTMSTMGVCSDSAKSCHHMSRGGVKRLRTTGGE